MKSQPMNRRQFLCRSTLLVAGAPLALRCGVNHLQGAEASTAVSRSLRANARVAITRCADYGAGVRPALARCFDSLGGIGALVKNKTVTVKLNLTSTDFTQFLGRPVGETFMTHFDTVRALGALLFEAGAKRVRLVESTQSKAPLQGSLALKAEVKRLFLFHHDPDHDDAKVESMLAHARKLVAAAGATLAVDAAREGVVVELAPSPEPKRAKV